jgi:hypothetical protein
MILAGTIVLWHTPFARGSLPGFSYAANNAGKCSRRKLQRIQWDLHFLIGFTAILLTLLLLSCQIFLFFLFKYYEIIFIRETSRVFV